jgi:mono/diheme cytochrome c family protein
MPALTFAKKGLLYAFPALAAGTAWVAFPVGVAEYVKPGQPDVGLTATAEDLSGHALFQQHCAYCHGPGGRGDGPAELTIKARAFGYDKFKFATTLNGVPTDENLLAVLKRGIPGSAMPSFGDLPEEQLKLLVGHVRDLNYAGLYGRVEAKQKKDDDLDPVQLHQQVAKLTTPGEPLPIPAFTEATPASLANGKKVYDTSCASCHGPKGQGDGPQEMKDDDGKPTRPRDLTRGQYKGGGTKPDLYARLVLGIPGTPMPASTTLKPEEVQDVLNYVLSLADKK